MPGARFQSGERVTLHTVEEADLDAFVRARSDPDIRIPRRRTTPATRDSVETFYEETVSEGDGYWFVAAVDGETVGSVAFPDVDPERRVAEVSVWVLPEYQRNGYGSDAVRALLTYGFEELRLNRVHADCLATDDAGRGLFESLAFTEEGRFREAALHAGDHVDVVRYGLLADEWGGA